VSDEAAKDEAAKPDETGEAAEAETPAAVQTGRRRQKMSTETIVIVGLLGAITIFLSVTRLGVIPVPNVSGGATIVHVPAILAGVLGGPVAGLFVGLIWGTIDWMTATVPLFADPLIAIVPRLFVGVFAYLVYRALRKRNVIFALGFAGWVGTVTNTVLVLALAVLRHYLPVQALVTIIPQALAEEVLGIILTIAIGAAYLRVRQPKRRRRRR
jgi:uncharacterized membrane protein